MGTIVSRRRGSKISAGPVSERQNGVGASDLSIRGTRLAAFVWPGRRGRRDRRGRWGRSSRGGGVRRSPRARCRNVRTASGLPICPFVELDLQLSFGQVGAAVAIGAVDGDDRLEAEGFEDLGGLGLD